MVIMRKGKTEKDRKAGAHARNESNKEARASWSRTKSKGSKIDEFPYDTCGGKKAYRRKA